MQTICLKFCRNKKKKALEVKETPRRTFLYLSFVIGHLTFHLLYAALLDAGFLTRTLAEVIEFGATYFAVFVNGDFLNKR